MKKAQILLLIQLFAITAFSQHKPAYKIYNTKGKEVSYWKMVKTLSGKDIILFGEIHNNPVSHWMQYELTADLHAERKLVLGAEMFEADNQEALDDYLGGEINKKELDSLARLWPNFKTDYAPLVDFARKEELPFVATNIPRRYASLVYKKGFEALDSLPPDEKEWIAPLPIPFDSELPAYQKILRMSGDHGSPELVKAQAIKDATMAHFILKNYQEGPIFLHFNGNYHSDNYEGILWYLKRERNDLKYATVSTVSQENVHELLPENHLLADFIICVDSDMTKTY